MARVRRFWRGAGELFWFLSACFMALARFATGRWPEPPGKDFLDPRPRRLIQVKAAAEEASKS